MKTKNNLIIYNNFIEPIKQLSNEDAGSLFKKLISYHFDNTITEDNQFVEFAFGMMKPLIDDNKRTYEQICQRNAKNGSKGGRPKKTQKTQSVNLETQQNPKKLNIKEDNIKEDNIKEDNLEDCVPDVLTLDMKFSEFFLEYGNPIKRGLALLEFKKLTSKDINEILKVVKSESFKDYSKEKGKYMQEPHNWLKAQGWLDDYSTPSNEEIKEPEKDYAKIDEIAAKYFGDEMVKRFGYKKLKAWSMGGMFADNGMSQGETHEVCKQVEKELKEKGLI